MLSVRNEYIMNTISGSGASYVKVTSSGVIDIARAYRHIMYIHASASGITLCLNRQIVRRKRFKFTNLDINIGCLLCVLNVDFLYGCTLVGMSLIFTLNDMYMWF